MSAAPGQTSSLRFELLLWQENYKRYLADLAPKKSEKSVICKDIELKFGIEAKFGSLSSKSNINLQFDVIKTSL